MNAHPSDYDPVRAVLERLPKARPTGEGKWTAPCPAHDDDKPSLTVARDDDGRVLLCCHAGCTQEAICRAIGLELRDLFPRKAEGANPARHGKAKGRIVTTYDYRDEAGGVLYQVVRYEPKDFRQRRPDGNGSWTWNLNGTRRVLYRLPELLAADKAAWRFVPEGEKDADNLAALGLVATTNPGGAGKWKRLADDSALHGCRVAIIPDKDAPGRAHAQDVAARLHGKAADVRIVDLPGDGKDASDWIEAHDAQDAEDLAAALVALAEAAPPFDPSAASSDAPRDDESPSPVLVCMADVEAKPLRWLWPRRIPLGKVTLLAGDPNLGKSLVTVDIAARVSGGAPWPDAQGQPGEPGTVILLSAEDDPADTIRPRLEAAGADLSKVHLLATVRQPDGKRTPFSLDRDLPALERALRDHPDARLIVIDPISAYLGRTDSHVNAEVRGILAPLTDLAARYSVAVVLVTHLAKGTGGKALHRSIGSIGFAATSRAEWLFIADKDSPDRRLMLPAKMNLAPDPTGLAYRITSVELPGIGSVGRVEWDARPVTTTANEALATESDDGESPGARQEAADFLRGVLQGGPVEAKEVKRQAAAARISSRTLDRAKANLHVKAGPEGFRGPWVWRLPPQSAPDSAQNANP